MLLESGRPRPSSEIGRAAVRGGVIGFIVVTLLVSSTYVWAGGGYGGVGVGLLVGFFGGTGFGSMLAATLQADGLARRDPKPRP